MRLLGKDQPWATGLEDRLGTRVQHLIAQASFEHPDDAPYVRFSAVFASQTGRKGHLVKYRRRSIGLRWGWRSRGHDRVDVSVVDGAIDEIDHVRRRLRRKRM